MKVRFFSTSCGVKFLFEQEMTQIPRVGEFLFFGCLYKVTFVMYAISGPGGEFNEVEVHFAYASKSEQEYYHNIQY